MSEEHVGWRYVQHLPLWFKLESDEQRAIGLFAENVGSSVEICRVFGRPRRHRTLSPLETILSQPPRAGQVRQIILLTDGQVTNEPAVVDLARKHRDRNRIFSFGIGSACSAFLVKGIARATAGAAEFISAGERIDDKVLRTFSRITSPPVTDVIIDWDGCEVQTLSELPPIFDGDVMAVFGRATGKLPRKITLTCNTTSGPRHWTVAVPPPLADGGVISTMWARRTIQSLEEIAGVGINRTRMPVPGRERDMMIQLSKQFGLLCSLTTFVAVEHRSPAERNRGEPMLRRVPINVPAGWGEADLDRNAFSIGGAAPASAPLYAMSPAPAAMPTGAKYGALAAFAGRVKKKISPGQVVRSRGAAPVSPPAQDMNPPQSGNDFGDGAGTGLLDLTRESDDTAMESAVAKVREMTTQHLLSEPRETPADQVKKFLSNQSADGWFHASAILDTCIADAGGNKAAWTVIITAAIPVKNGSARNVEQIVRTAIVVCLLAAKFSDLHDLWKRAYVKAVRYLAEEFGMSTAAAEAWVIDMRAKLAI